MGRICAERAVRIRTLFTESFHQKMQKIACSVPSMPPHAFWHVACSHTAHRETDEESGEAGGVGFLCLDGGREDTMSGTSSERRLTYVYRITSDDVIEFVNDAWLRFAEENAAPTLSQQVIGTSLWKHVSGQQVVTLSRELLTRVRQSGREVTIPFRCDSPALRRYMRMKFVPLGNSKVEFHSWIEREEPIREPIRLLDASAMRDPAKLLRMCAWCKKIHVAGSWFEIEDAIGQLRLFDKLTIPVISHGMCDGCFKLLAF